MRFPRSDARLEVNGTATSWFSMNIRLEALQCIAFGIACRVVVEESWSCEDVPIAILYAEAINERMKSYGEAVAFWFGYGQYNVIPNM